MRGLDYSAARISGAAIRAAGFDFVLRYVDDPARGLSSKHIRPDEYADLKLSGVQVWLVCERTVQDSQGGFSGGAQLATAARKGADWIGYPPDGLIFFTADRHLSASEVNVALTFLDGAASVLGRNCIGCYGFYELVNAAAAQNRASAYWLAGSKPPPNSPAHIWQRNDTSTTVGAVTCDINEMLKPLPSSAPPPPPPPEPGMDAATLAAVMGNSSGVPYGLYLQPFIDGMIAAQCTNVNRAAMWCAQLGEESGGLRWMEELGSGAEYNGRADLGNTSPGDGQRYKGRGPIQLTGKFNYGKFSQWCHSKGYVDSDTYFVDNPTLVSQPRWGFLAASWYWTVARADINTFADRGDVTTVTRRINGGLNGLADRQARYNRALSFGARLLPQEDDMAQVPQDEWNQVRDLVRWMWSQMAGQDAAPFEFTGWPSFENGSGKALTLVDYHRQADVQLEELKSRVSAIESKLT